MDIETKTYRTRQFDRLTPNNEFVPQIKIYWTGTQTNCLSITEDELEQIKQILIGNE